MSGREGGGRERREYGCSTGWLEMRRRVYRREFDIFNVGQITKLTLLRLLRFNKP